MKWTQLKTVKAHTLKSAVLQNYKTQGYLCYVFKS
jgi:hypothetical protein